MYNYMLQLYEISDFFAASYANFLLACVNVVISQMWCDLIGTTMFANARFLSECPMSIR